MQAICNSERKLFMNSIGRQTYFPFILSSVMLHLALLSYVHQKTEISDLVFNDVDQKEILKVVLKQKMVESRPQPKKALKSVTKKTTPRIVEKKVMKTTPTLQSQVAKIKGNKRDQIINQYTMQLKEFLDKNKKYPRMAARMGQSGIVEVKLSIDSSGGFRDVTVINPAKFESLNASTIKYLKKLGRFKPLPKEFFPKEDFIVPIVYKLSRKTR
jgi:protein TonB